MANDDQRHKKYVRLVSNLCLSLNISNAHNISCSKNHVNLVLHRSCLQYQKFKVVRMAVWICVYVAKYPQIEGFLLLMLWILS